MAKAPAFQFYSADWFIDTAQMSRSAKGLHIDLLAIQWSNGFLQADEKGNPTGLNADDLILWELIKHKYHLIEGKLINSKLEERRAAHNKFLGRQGKNGEKGGRPGKGETQIKPKLNPNESQTITQKNPLEEEDEVEEEVKDEKKEDGAEGENPYLVHGMLKTWKKHKPSYPTEEDKDLPALQGLAEFICKQAKIPYNPRDGECMGLILAEWDKWAVFISKHDFFKRYSIAQVNTHSQNILQSIQDGTTKRKTNQQNQQPTGVVISGTKDYGHL